MQLLSQFISLQCSVCLCISRQGKETGWLERAAPRRIIWGRKCCECFVTHISPLSTVSMEVHQDIRVTGLSTQAAQLLRAALTPSTDAAKMELQTCFTASRRRWGCILVEFRSSKFWYHILKWKTNLRRKLRGGLSCVLLFEVFFGWGED